MRAMKESSSSFSVGGGGRGGGASRGTEPQVQQRPYDRRPYRSHEKTTSIAKLFAVASELWRTILQALSNQDLCGKASLNKLQSVYSYFSLWADGYGVQSGKFQDEIRNSHRAGDLSIRLLQNICTTLSRRLIPLLKAQNAPGMSLKVAEVSLEAERLVLLIQGDHCSDDSSDDDDDDRSADLPQTSESLEQIAAELRTDTQCLMDLGDSFEDQIKNPIVSEAAANPSDYNTWIPSVHFIKRILLRYPKCEIDMIQCLGEAIWLRLSKYEGTKLRRTSQRAGYQDETAKLDEVVEPSSLDSIGKRRPASSLDVSLFQYSANNTADTIGETPEAGFNILSILPLS
ncbi:hypothetical protein PG994_008314 [Apiospora phragmitis]|uniref:Dilute domain-containing protein n=1 Tax=Apiospora phragmitis TaxID=2905665 RepID=A0ABR1USP6_9PEZI